jgi:CheY-like chemotaxis protein
VDEAIESVAIEKTETAKVRGRKTVLIAEDEEAVRELASEFVKSAGYNVVTARDGADALAIATKSTDPIHVLLTDVVMPRMRGPELANRLRSIRNDLKIVYMTGYLEYKRGSEEFVRDGLFLQKPFSRATLVAQVQEALKDELAVAR